MFFIFEEFVDEIMSDYQLALDEDENCSDSLQGNILIFIFLAMNKVGVLVYLTGAVAPLSLPAARTPCGGTSLWGNVRQCLLHAVWRWRGCSRPEQLVFQVAAPRVIRAKVIVARRHLLHSPSGRLLLWQGFTTNDNTDDDRYMN